MVAPRIVAVFGSSETTPADGNWALGVEVGRRLAGAGLGIANGGYSGLMEAVSQGAAENGGHVVGVIAPDLFPARPGGNSYLTETIEADSLTERIHIMDRLSSGFIALPGSIGTLTELLIALNDAAISPLRDAVPRPVVATRDPWQTQLAGTAVPSDVVTYADGAPDIVAKTLDLLSRG